MNKIFLKRKITPRVVNGHPWIFNNEVEPQSLQESIDDGSIVEVYTYDKKFIGNGYFNANHK